MGSLMAVRVACLKMRDAVDSLSIWNHVPLVLSGNLLNLPAIRCTNLFVRKSEVRGCVVTRRGTCDESNSVYYLKRPRMFHDVSYDVRADWHSLT